MRRTITRFLADQKLEEGFVECASGEEAVTAFAHYHPSLVLMDIQLEGMDGLQATRAIRRSAPEARILIVTSFDDLHLREAAREAGAIGYVLKDNLSEIQNYLRR